MKTNHPAVTVITHGAPAMIAPPDLGLDLNGNPYVARGQYRTADGKATIEWTLAKHRTTGEHLFSASGNGPGYGGQSLDRMAEDYPSDTTVQEMAAVWRLYHLNDMTPGTPEQMAHLAKLGDKPRTYEQSVDALKAAGLYTVKHEGKPYTYGSAWLTRLIPAPVVEQIKGWASRDNTAGESGYEATARAFLSRNGLALRITRSDSKPAPWHNETEGERHHYRVTLSRPRVDTPERLTSAPGSTRLAFDFWGSIADAKQDKDPSAYDVLACVSSDIHTPETFADFCAEYGEDSDSIKARQTWKRADSFARRLRAFFSDAERAELQEIN